MDLFACLHYDIHTHDRGPPYLDARDSAHALCAVLHGDCDLEESETS